jgi:hypothetical protein
MVELIGGGGTFHVEEGNDEKASDQFQVETGLGRVTAWESAFQVCLLPGNKLAVNVNEGMVEVDLAGDTHVLSGGQGQLFNRGAGRFSREFRGYLTAIDDRAIFIRRGNGSELEFPLADNLQVMIDRKPARRADLVPGTIVYLEQAEDQLAVGVIRAEGPTHGGVVQAVDPGARTITVVKQRFAPVVRAQRAYTIAPDAQVTIGGTPAPLSEVQAGAKVMLRLSVDRKTVVHVAAGGKSDGR